MEKTVVIFMMLAIFISLCALFFILVSNLYDRKSKSKKKPAADGAERGKGKANNKK